MLYVECGTGHFLETFWAAGFDITATVSSPADLHKTRTRIGRRAELHLTHPDDLPFEDNSYDYVLLITTLDYCPRPNQILAEASRVCAKEMLISFLNKHSLYLLSLARSKNTRAPRPTNWWSWPSMRLCVYHNLGPRRVRSKAGILPGPYHTWHARAACKAVNSLLCPNIFGAYCTMLLDMTGERVRTPLPAWVQPRTDAAAPSPNQIQAASPPADRIFIRPRITKAAPHTLLQPSLLRRMPGWAANRRPGAGCGADRTWPAPVQPKAAHDRTEAA